MLGGGRAAVVQNAKLRSAVLANAASARPGWLAEIDGELARAIAASPRMRARVLALGAANGAGDPVALSGPARYLTKADAPIQRKAAACAGFIYHLAGFGPTLGKETIEVLVRALGRDVVDFGLRHAHLSPAPGDPLPLEDCRAVIETDGARILELWIADLGPAAIWLPRFNPDPKRGSVAILRPVARAIAEAVLRELSNSVRKT